jgi:hypothetical protein
MNRGDNGDIGKRKLLAVGEDGFANFTVVGVGVRLNKNVGDTGDIAPIPNVELISDTVKPGDME